MSANSSSRVSAPGDAISTILLEENWDTFAAARQAIVEKVLLATVQEAINELGSPEAIAQKALAYVEVEQAVLVKARQRLTERLLQDVAREATEALADANEAAQQAQAHVGDRPEAVARGAEALERRLRAEIAREATEALSDADEAAQRARTHLGEDALIVQAVEVLRELLIQEIARHSTEALADAQQVARQAGTLVGDEHEAIVQAVDALKKQILQTIVSSSLAQIQAEVEGGRGGLALAALANPPLTGVPAPGEAARRIETLVVPDAARSGGDGYQGAHDPVSENRPTLPNLLLLEDHPDTRKLLTRLLSPHYAVVETTNAKEALAAAREGGAFDVLLLDIHLGGGPNGCEVLAGVRAMPGYEAVPAVACTAHVSQADFERLLAAGFTAVVAKPIKKAILLDALHRLIGKRSGPETGPPS